MGIITYELAHPVTLTTPEKPQAITYRARTSPDAIPTITDCSWPGNYHPFVQQPDISLDVTPRGDGIITLPKQKKNARFHYYLGSDGHIYKTKKNTIRIGADKVNETIGLVEKEQLPRHATRRSLRCQALITYAYNGGYVPSEAQRAMRAQRAEHFHKLLQQVTQSDEDIP